MTFELDLGGSVTSPLGYSAGAVYAGMKSYGEAKLDLGIVASVDPCVATAVFTKNRLRSASVDINRDHIANGVAQAVVVNSGVANSSTGAKGLEDARQVAQWVGSKLGLGAFDVLVCSTGVIGPFLPMEKMKAGIDAITLSPLSGKNFARAIMTTDTRPKHASVKVGPYTLGGCAKGSGMIHPNMATMLAFLTTDAPLDPVFIRDELRDAVDRSFNVISVDGDTSPSDTVILLANGRAGGEAIFAGTPLSVEFGLALRELCTYLAKEIARDGEGASKLIEVNVTGALNYDEARTVIHTITTSYLIKSAIYGADPNWGRIVSAVGRTGATYDEENVRVRLCGHLVFADQRPTTFDPAAISRDMKADLVVIDIELGAGTFDLTGWGCDLTEEYVKINAEYTT